MLLNLSKLVLIQHLILCCKALLDQDIQFNAWLNRIIRLAQTLLEISFSINVIKLMIALLVFVALIYHIKHIIFQELAHHSIVLQSHKTALELLFLKIILMEVLFYKTQMQLLGTAPQILVQLFNKT